MESADPWIDFAARHRRGETVVGQVSEVVDNIGLFVDLGRNAFGIVHLSDLSWDSTGEQGVRVYSIGQWVRAVILSIDVDRQRISLGVKQLTQKPWEPKNRRRGPPNTGSEPSDSPVGPAPKPSLDSGAMKLGG